MSDADECVHGWDPAWCGDCRPRENAVDLHATRGRSAIGPEYAREVAATVVLNGDTFGLVPSDGTAYVFGAGTALHHDRECYEGSDTPDERVRSYPDPDGNLWRAVVDQTAAAQQVVNVSRRPVTKCCPLCTLRPDYS